MALTHTCYCESPSHYTSACPHGLADPAPQPDRVKVLRTGTKFADGVQPGLHQLADAAADSQHISLKVFLLKLLSILGKGSVVHAHVVQTPVPGVHHTRLYHHSTNIYVFDYLKNTNKVYLVPTLMV